MKQQQNKRTTLDPLIADHFEKIEDTEEVDAASEEETHSRKRTPSSIGEYELKVLRFWRVWNNNPRLVTRFLWLM